MEVSGQLHTPAVLPPGKEPPETHCIGVWLDPKAGLDTVAERKSPLHCPRQELKPDRPGYSLISVKRNEAHRRFKAYDECSS